jgi:hypothetical protein
VWSGNLSPINEFLVVSQPENGNCHYYNRTIIFTLELAQTSTFQCKAIRFILCHKQQSIISAINMSGRMLHYQGPSGVKFL